MTFMNSNKQKFNVTSTEHQGYGELEASLVTTLVKVDELQASDTQEAVDPRDSDNEGESLSRLYTNGLNLYVTKHYPFPQSFLKELYGSILGEKYDISAPINSAVFGSCEGCENMMGCFSYEKMEDVSTFVAFYDGKLLELEQSSGTSGIDGDTDDGDTDEEDLNVREINDTQAQKNILHQKVMELKQRADPYGSHQDCNKWFEWGYTNILLKYITDDEETKVIEKAYYCDMGDFEWTPPHCLSLPPHWKI